MTQNKTVDSKVFPLKLHSRFLSKRICMGKETT